MHVHVSTPKCVSSGQCVLIAPGVFDQREDDGVTVLLDESPAPELYDEVREAARICPASAIRLVE